ncbi:hypothetical protein V1511DRAFT_503719 [Dipodascopsis uninucleata]
MGAARISSASIGWGARLWNLIPRLQLNVPSTSVVIPPIVLRLPIPSDLGLGLGNNPFGIVFAVPKKKVSLRRRRNRQLAPGKKQIKPVEALTECPSCGRVKRAHTVCTPCHEDVKKVWRAENGELTKEDLEIPETVSKEYLKLTQKEPPTMAVNKRLQIISKKENNRKKPDMFAWQKLKKPAKDSEEQC